MFYVLWKVSHEVFAVETVRPQAGAYNPATFEVVYSELPLNLGDVVAPDLICTRLLKASDKFIAGDGVDAVTLIISDYGTETVLDVNGDRITVPLVDNWAEIPITSRVPPVDLEIRGVNGPLSECSTRVYVR